MPHCHCFDLIKSIHYKQIRYFFLVFYVTSCICLKQQNFYLQSFSHFFVSYLTINTYYVLYSGSFYVVIGSEKFLLFVDSQLQQRPYRIVPNSTPWSISEIGQLVNFFRISKMAVLQQGSSFSLRVIGFVNGKINFES